MRSASLRPLAAALLAAALVVSLHAPAQSRIAVRPSGGDSYGGYGHSHDAGFFLRLSAGGGGAKTEADVVLGSTPGTLEFSGGAGNMNIAIGGIVAPNLALHGTLWGWTVSGPNVDWSAGGDGWVPGDLTMAAVGGGATYYFMPVNLYVSSSLGFGRLDLEGGSTDAGFAMDFTLGKEWWVGERWGLGLAGSLGFHDIPEKDADNNWKGSSVGIRFSATMN
ncbi:MAG: hypothetical protein R3C71_02905 [Candidatus Krumholzibacteriia bacterium]|nr:hypothetical protein [Candidatus Latescibacterota bacterium]